MNDLEPKLRTAATRIFTYLAEADAPPARPVDAVIGFGVFDLTLPVYCGDLFAGGQARRIIFTGGLGAGTGQLGGREADVWRDALRRSHPAIPDHKVILENRSTNTAENISFTAELLEREYPQHAFGVGIRSAIIVASPSRLRRVKLTMQKLQPTVTVIRQLPPHSLDEQRELYAANRVDYFDHLAGELDRIVGYAARGWIAVEPLPPEIAAAHDLLKQLRPD